jgi:hypothetical protein
VILDGHVRIFLDFVSHLMPMLYRFTKPGCGSIFQNQVAPVDRAGCPGVPGDPYNRQEVSNLQEAFSSNDEITLNTPVIALTDPLPGSVNEAGGTETIAIIEMICADSPFLHNPLHA